MALSRYVLTATVTLPPGTFVPDVATDGPPANFGTGSNTSAAGAWGSGNGVVVGDAGTTFFKGTAIVADPSGFLYAAIGAGNLRAFIDGTDDVGHAALAN
jgi:hypothetical protein